MSCLRQDFKILSDGDQTIVGEKGVTLSGGQKARLALARSVYADADIYLLDDPISAVDSKVAKNIFFKCLRPLAKQKTVILTTHQVGYLSECDEVIILDDGAIIEKGTPTQLKKKLDDLCDKEEEQEEGQEPKDQLSSILKARSHEVSQLSAGMLSDLQIGKGIDKSKILLARFVEKDAKLNFSTYLNFFTASKFNYVLFPVTILLFILS